VPTSRKKIVKFSQSFTAHMREETHYSSNLGHEDIGTTQIYTKVNPEHMTRTIKRVFKEN
jgi:site-specific recombinase XerC